MFDVAVNGDAHQEMHVDGGASMQTFLYPAALQVSKLPTDAGPRPRTAYVIRNGRLTQGWDQVARNTPAIATRAVATLTTNSGVGDLYRIYARQSAMAFASGSVISRTTSSSLILGSSIVST
jgi:hypothetical protein